MWIHGERHATHKQQTQKHASYLQGKQFPRLKTGFKHDSKTIGRCHTTTSFEIKREETRSECTRQRSRAGSGRASKVKQTTTPPPSAARARIPTAVAGQESSRAARRRRRIAPREQRLRQKKGEGEGVAEASAGRGRRSTLRQGEERGGRGESGGGGGAAEWGCGFQVNGQAVISGGVVVRAGEKETGECVRGGIITGRIKKLIT